MNQQNWKQESSSAQQSKANVKYVMIPEVEFRNNTSNCIYTCCIFDKYASHDMLKSLLTSMMVHEVSIKWCPKNPATTAAPSSNPNAKKPTLPDESSTSTSYMTVNLGISKTPNNHETRHWGGLKHLIASWMEFYEISWIDMSNFLAFSRCRKVPCLRGCYFIVPPDEFIHWEKNSGSFESRYSLDLRVR